MKKNDVILIVSLVLYSYLFYAQSGGINFLVLSICLICGLLIKDKKLLKNRAWFATAGASICTGVCVMLYGNTLAAFANLLSLSLAASYAFNKSSSLVFASLLSAYSYVSSLFFMVANAIERKTIYQTQPGYAKLMITAVPLAVVGVFFALYREANPLFKNLTDNFSLHLITWNWIGFTSLGFVFLYGFYNQQNVLALLMIDRNGSDDLDKQRFDKENPNSPLTIVQENTLGIVLFVMLNLLLLIVNGLDINYLWISHTLPDGLSYSELVHQGINMLIVSIVIAILIILYYFRGRLNFYSKNSTVKTLVYLWMAQNAIMIVSSAIKNDLYIDEFGFTYKRIGVYVYLILALIGLVTTCIKVGRAKSNWFLFRKNAWAFYTVLVISCFVNWDRMIADYNINYSKTLDKMYLLRLSDSVLPALMELENKGEPDPEYSNILHTRKLEFKAKEAGEGWQSWNLEDRRVTSYLNDNK